MGYHFEHDTDCSPESGAWSDVGFEAKTLLESRKKGENNQTTTQNTFRNHKQMAQTQNWLTWFLIQLENIDRSPVTDSTGKRCKNSFFRLQRDFIGAKTMRIWNEFTKHRKSPSEMIESERITADQSHASFFQSASRAFLQIGNDSYTSGSQFGIANLHHKWFPKEIDWWESLEISHIFSVLSGKLSQFWI